MDEDDAPCGHCSQNQYESRKVLWIQCTACHPGWYHASCLGFTGATVRALERSRNWKCGRGCSSTSNAAQPDVATLGTTAAQPVPNAPLPLEPWYPGFRIIKRIPKGARHLAATKLAEIIDRCTEENTADAWAELLNFAWLRLFKPTFGKGRSKKDYPSLTTKVKHQPRVQKTFQEQDNVFIKIPQILYSAEFCIIGVYCMTNPAEFIKLNIR